MRMNQFIFGNSLVNFARGDGQTNISHWMDRMADAAGHTYRMDGGWGFLRNFADAEEPSSNWDIRGVRHLFNANRDTFDEARIDSVIIAPANFIQDRGPQQNYFGDDRSPFDAALEVVDDVEFSQPRADIFIYEGWADMSPFAGDDVPDDNQLDRYYDYNSGDYHDWYLRFVGLLNEASPDANVQLIPVASVLADLFTNTELADIPPEDLYVDSAPHGTETLYFLAGMITYSSVFGEPPPDDMRIPRRIDPLVRNNYEQLGDYIFDRVQEYATGEAGGGDTDPDPDPDGDGGGSGGEDGYHTTRDETIDIDEGGRYRFILRSDSEAALVVDGRLVLATDGGGERERTAIFLSRGEHSVQVYQPEGRNIDDAILRWRPVGSNNRAREAEETQDTPDEPLRAAEIAAMMTQTNDPAFDEPPPAEPEDEICET